MSLGEAVWVDPGRMSGTPCFRGTRVPVEQLFDWLADGIALDEFLDDFALDRRAAEAVLREGCSGRLHCGPQESRLRDPNLDHAS